MEGEWYVRGSVTLMPLENNYETVDAFSRETILIILTQYLHVANRPAWTQRGLRIDNRY